MTKKRKTNFIGFGELFIGISAVSSIAISSQSETISNLFFAGTILFAVIGLAFVCVGKFSKEVKPTSSDNENEDSQNKVEDDATTLEFVIKDVFSLISSTDILENDADFYSYKEHLLYANSSICVAKLTDKQVINFLETRNSEMWLRHSAQPTDIFNDSALNGRIFKRVYIFDKHDMGGDTFSNDEMLKAYESVTDTFNRIPKNASLEKINVAGIEVCKFESKNSKDILPIFLTSMTLDEINALNWTTNPFSKEIIKFNSVAEFNMYCNSLIGTSYGVSRLMDLKKDLENSINALTNIKSDAMKLFNMENENE